MKLKTILLSLLMVAMLASLSSAEYIFPGNVSPQSLKEDLAALVMAGYTNETVINATAANVALGQTAQNDTLANLALGEAYQNTTLDNLALGEAYQNTTLDNLALGQTWQNDSISNLIAGNTDQNITIEQHERSLVDNVSPSILALEGYDPKFTIIGGGTPGNFTLTGAAAGDALAGVAYLNVTGTVALTDLSSQFSIPDTDILNQTYSGGTSSLNGYLLVSWVDKA